jgi:hypothetical protein
MRKSKTNGATIPYQLRPRKAIERNIFVDLLKQIGTYNRINFKDYRYVGFGAAYLEDFKQMHIELGIVDMDCIEMDNNAFSRQKFNNPYHFVKPYNVSSTEYIDQIYKSDKNQIIWLDYSVPGQLRQQFTDIEMLCSKITDLDIIKFTFNSKLISFITSHQLKDSHGRYFRETDSKLLLNFLKNDPTFTKYLPEEVSTRNFSNFDAVIRAMAIRAINRGLSTGNKKLNFHHLAAFSYADGQEMTTLTGFVCSDEVFGEMLDQSKLLDWSFYNNPDGETELIDAVEIAVPDMTVSERIEIDKKIPAVDIDAIAKELVFNYGNDIDEHVYLINGYHTFYKYLPYFSKVIY